MILLGLSFQPNFQVAQTPTDPILEAKKYYDLEDYEGVIDLLTPLASDEKNGDYEILLADAEQKLESFENAIKHYNRAEKYGIQTEDLYFHRAAAYISSSNFKKSIKDLDKALTLNPSNATYYFYRGYAYTEMDNNDQALASYTHAIEHRPEYAEAYYNRGAIKIDMGLLEQGADDLKMAKKLSGGDLDTDFNLALIAYETGNYDEALNLFSELADSEDALQKQDASYFMAECYYHLDDQENACRYFYKAMILGDKDAEEVYYNYCQKGQIRKFLKERKKTDKVTF